MLSLINRSLAWTPVIAHYFPFLQLTFKAVLEYFILSPPPPGSCILLEAFGILSSFMWITGPAQRGFAFIIMHSMLTNLSLSKTGILSCLPDAVAKSLECGLRMWEIGSSVRCESN